MWSRLLLLLIPFLLPSGWLTSSSSAGRSGCLLGIASASDVPDPDANHRDGLLPPSSTKERPRGLGVALSNAAKRGLGGGLSGGIAGVVQVLTMMWLRTVINYQSRYGTSFVKSLEILYKEGGIWRFYRGISFAIVQAPLARFVATAANDGVNALLAGLEATKTWGAGRSTVVASIVVGLFRILLMPIDTCKTVLQVDSKDGFQNLLMRVKSGKPGVLYQGALATAIASVLGHYPWFFTFNLLSQNAWLAELIPSPLLRNAGIALGASIVSDTAVNAVRVVKTTKQSLGPKHDISYLDTIRMVVAADGWKGLFGRGLRARILANSMQSIVFAITWRGLAEMWQKQRDEAQHETAPEQPTPATLD